MAEQPDGMAAGYFAPKGECRRRLSIRATRHADALAAGEGKNGHRHLDLGTLIPLSLVVENSKSLLYTLESLFLSLSLSLSPRPR